MGNTIKPKRSYTANSVPLTTDLEVNELAIRWTADSPAIFTKNASGQIVTVALGGSSGGGGGGSSSLVTAATVAGFPATGSAANLFVATDTNRIYRWDSTNSIYVELGPLASSGDTLLRSYLVPTAPSDVVATAGNAQASLSWTAASSLSQIPITDYLIQSSTDNGTTWTLASDTVSTATSATITGLTNGTAIRFRVAAVSGVGTGAYSAASSAVTPQAGVQVDYLVVAGGGGAGISDGASGAGGGGGLRFGSAMLLNQGQQYIVTVGAGGASRGTAGYTNLGQGNNGSVSSFNGVEAAGGGGGGGGSGGGQVGRDGGSGGGGCYGFSAGGAGNTPATTPSQGNAGGTGGPQSGAHGTGGGGGAGAAGGVGLGSGAGAGGSGAASSITGASVMYAGGGGGGNQTDGYPTAPGGAGGGGRGNGTSGGPQNGEANKGGGGGGGLDASQNYTATSGGSGVVIIRSPVAAASTTGSPTVTTVSGDTVYTFTGSGSITF